MTDLDAAIADADNRDNDRVQFFWSKGSVFMPKRFKRLKFLKLYKDDPYAALELAFGQDEIDRLADEDYTDEEFQELMETLARAIGGDRGNLPPSQS